MNQPGEKLRSHLNPTAVRILKKRLVSGKITPQVFKDILKQQMIKYFFQTYRHPLKKTWENCFGSARKLRKSNQTALLQSGTSGSETYHHKQF